MKVKNLGIAVLCIWAGVSAVPRDFGDDTSPDQSSQDQAAGQPVSQTLNKAFQNTVNSLPGMPLKAKSLQMVNRNWTKWFNYMVDRYGSAVMMALRSGNPDIFENNITEVAGSFPYSQPYPKVDAKGVMELPAYKSYPKNSDGTTFYDAPYYYVKSNPVCGYAPLPGATKSCLDSGKAACSNDPNPDACLKDYYLWYGVNNFIESGMYDNVKYDRMLLTEILMARLEGATGILSGDVTSKSVKTNLKYSIPFPSLAGMGMVDFSGKLYSINTPYDVSTVFKQMKIMSNVVRNLLASNDVMTLSPAHTFMGFIVINNTKVVANRSFKVILSSDSQGKSINGQTVGMLPVIAPVNSIPSSQWSSDTNARISSLGLAGISGAQFPFSIQCSYGSDTTNNFPPYDAVQKTSCTISFQNNVIPFEAHQLASFFKTPQQWMAVIQVDNNATGGVSTDTVVLTHLIKINSLEMPLNFVASIGAQDVPFTEKQLIDAPYTLYSDIYTTGATNDFVRGLYNGYLESSGMEKTNDMFMNFALKVSRQAISSMYFKVNKDLKGIKDFKDKLENPGVNLKQTPFYQVVLAVPKK